MNLIRAERKTRRIKQAMLKDVFRENLRMNGQEIENPRRRNIVLTSIIGSVAILAAVTYFFINNFSYSGQQFFQYRRQGVSIPQNSLPETNAGISQFRTQGGDVAQYRTLLAESNIPLSNLFGLKVKTIIIDPGHGGEDPGATGRLGTQEKNVTLDISKRLRERLKQHKGYRIKMTRSDDRTLSLDQRIAFAKTQRADLFISIHVNYIPRKPINVIETYYFGVNRDRIALLLAQRENKGSQYTLSDFRDIIQKIGNTLKTQESRVLARHIQNRLFRNIRQQNKESVNYGIKTAPFVVLLGVDVPSVLTEVTCLSNTQEERKLANSSYREEIARYLEEGIVDYLNQKYNNREVWYGTKRVTNQER